MIRLKSTLLKTLALASFFTLFIFASSGEAATVTQVKGKSVLINLQGDQIKAGDLMVVVDAAGKTRGIVKVRRVSGNRAIAVLGKGRAQAGWMLQARGAAKKSSTAAKAAPSQKSGSQTSASSQSYWGTLFGLGMNSLTVDQVNASGVATGESVALKGMGFSAKAFYDYNIFTSFWFRGMTGLEQLNASGNRPSDSVSLKQDIMYLTFDLWGRFVFSTSNIRPWVGGGFSIMFPASKSGTALESASITNTSLMSFGVGLDYFRSGNFFIPISLEYGLYPESERVSANTIAFRAGLGWSL